jgi:hypothetical protein
VEELLNFSEVTAVPLGLLQEEQVKLGLSVKAEMVPLIRATTTPLVEVVEVVSTAVVEVEQTVLAHHPMAVVAVVAVQA